VLLIVNTASACGFTPQFAGLEELHQTYGDRGLVVLGFPCNQFGGQDPGSNDEIASFCQLNYGVSFPMMAKIDVNGARPRPLYRWLTAEAPGLLGSKAIKWNFTKFLVGKDGQVIRRYAPQDAPEKLAGRHRGRGAGGALAGYFPSVGGERAPDADLCVALDDVLGRERARIQGLVARRSTQTNEIGRCAVLWPLLAQVADVTGARPLALLDFGCSAGLNLGVDHYRYRHGDVAWGAPAGAATPEIDCHPVHGRSPPALAAPRIAQRLGVDPAPVDVHDEAALRWLRACLWPHDRARMLRFDQAAGIVRGAGWPVQAAPDAYAAIEPWLDTLDAGVQPVVFNSWVLAYFEPAALAAHVAAMRALVQRRGIAWLSAEGQGLLLGPAPTALDADGTVSAVDLANATLWWLTLPGAAGAARTTLRARSHPHGRWAHWE
jgi:glutathione peroxidase-family protein